MITLAAAVLAAGASSRMRRSKAGLRTSSGETFLERAVARAAGVGARPILVVAGAHALAPPAGARLVQNPEWPRGQLSSLQAAIRALAGEPCEALLVLLVDHPDVAPGTFERIVDAYRRARPAVVRPRHQGRGGHPILIAASLFDELLAAPDDRGARPVLARHADETVVVEVEDPAILQDLDTPEDVRRR